MSLRNRVFIAIVVAACLVGFYRVQSTQLSLPPIKPQQSMFSGDDELPDFTTFNNVDEKKQAFFSFMLPLVEQENQRIGALREELHQLSAHVDTLSDRERRWLLQLAQFYRVVASDTGTANLDPQWVIERLLLRVDQVPPSLALAQAANESAWGTSRFAQQGNNLYGQWCFKTGCGLVPNNRPEGANYEVARFSSPLHSVQRYIHNLNTHLAYKDFRLTRAELRRDNEPLSGKKIAETLHRYSTRGSDYIGELRAMIRVNDLSQYDTI